MKLVPAAAGLARSLAWGGDERRGVNYTVMYFSASRPGQGAATGTAVLREFANFFGGILPLFRQAL